MHYFFQAGPWGLTSYQTLVFPTQSCCICAAGAHSAAPCWDLGAPCTAATLKQKALVGEASCSSQTLVLSGCSCAGHRFPPLRVPSGQPSALLSSHSLPESMLELELCETLLCCCWKRGICCQGAGAGVGRRQAASPCSVSACGFSYAQ